MENEAEEKCKFIADALTAHLNREETKHKMFQWRAGTIFWGKCMAFEVCIVCMLFVTGYGGEMVNFFKKKCLIMYI